MQTSGCRDLPNGLQTAGADAMVTTDNRRSEMHRSRCNYSIRHVWDICAGHLAHSIHDLGVERCFLEDVGWFSGSRFFSMRYTISAKLIVESKIGLPAAAA